MEQNGNDHARFILRKLISAGPPTSSAAHPWISEDDRWAELVFSIFSRVAANVSESEARRAVHRLVSLDLLEMCALASMYEGMQSGHSDDGRMQLITDLLREHGYNDVDSRRGLFLVCGVASGLGKQFAGKVQRYLRHYGELMLSDLDNVFEIPSSDRAAFAAAFTYWLQNGLSMPVSLVDHTMWNFCEDNGVTPEELIAAADDLNLNVAFLDDLIQES